MTTINHVEDTITTRSLRRMCRQVLAALVKSECGDPLLTATLARGNPNRELAIELLVGMDLIHTEQGADGAYMAVLVHRYDGEFSLRAFDAVDFELAMFGVDLDEMRDRVRVRHESERQVRELLQARKRYAELVEDELFASTYLKDARSTHRRSIENFAWRTRRIKSGEEVIKRGRQGGTMGSLKRAELDIQFSEWLVEHHQTRLGEIQFELEALRKQHPGITRLR